MQNNLIPYQWYKYFPSYFDMPDSIKHSIRVNFSEGQSVPHRPLSYFRPEETKIVILDSKPSSSRSNGLAYSYDLFFRVGLAAEDLTLSDDGLEQLAKQGVLLINARPWADKLAKGIGWNNLMKEFLRKFSSDYPGRVYMLFGSGVAHLEKAIAKPGNKIIISPRPEGFLDANDYLERKGLGSIDWERG